MYSSSTNSQQLSSKVSRTGNGHCSSYFERSIWIANKFIGGPLEENNSEQFHSYSWPHSSDGAWKSSGFRRYQCSIWSECEHVSRSSVFVETTGCSVSNTAIRNLDVSLRSQQLSSKIFTTDGDLLKVFFHKRHVKNYSFELPYLTSLSSLACSIPTLQAFSREPRNRLDYSQGVSPEGNRPRRVQWWYWVSVLERSKVTKLTFSKYQLYATFGV